MPDFRLVADFQPTGDQPQAITQLVASIRAGHRHQTLLGVTGSGKTFTMANVMARLNRPAMPAHSGKSGGASTTIAAAPASSQRCSSA